MRVVLVLSLLAAGACERGPSSSSGGPQGAAKVRDDLVVAISGEPTTLFQPYFNNMYSRMVVMPGSYALTSLGEDAVHVPWAAEAIPTVQAGTLAVVDDGGAQRLRATWRIKPDLRWPDGAPPTGDDFVLAYDVCRDERQAVPFRSECEDVLKMEVQGEDRRTLVVTWRSPTVIAAQGEHGALPAHLLRKSFQDAPDTFVRDPFGTKPLLAGAFTVQEWKPGDHVRLVRNPATTGAFAPQLARITYRFIPDGRAMEAALISGEIDVIGFPGLETEQAFELEKRVAATHDVKIGNQAWLSRVSMNHAHPALADVRVRRALQLGFDRAALVRDMFAGRVEVANQTVRAASKFHAPDATPTTFDPARAGALLDEAGWKMPSGAGAAAVREKDGAPLRLTLLYGSGRVAGERIAATLRTSWQRLGVEIVEKTAPPPMVLKLVRAGDFDLNLSASGVSQTTIDAEWWGCAGRVDRKTGGGGMNFMGWCDEKVDELLAVVNGEIDEEKRIAAGRAFQRLFVDAVPVIPLYFQPQVVVVPKALRGFTMTAAAGFDRAAQWSWAPPSP